MAHAHPPTPFPKPLRWALLAPLAGFVLGMIVLPALFAPILPDKILKSSSLAVIAMSGLIELIAVPVALFMLLRGGPYVTRGNIVITLVASMCALPVVRISMGRHTPAWGDCPFTSISRSCLSFSAVRAVMS